MVMESVVAEGFLDLPGTGRSDALIDRQCLPQVRGGLTAVAVVEVTAADALQGLFLERHAAITGDGERLGVLTAGPAVSGVRDDSSPRLFSASACPSREPRSRQSSRDCCRLVAAVG